MTLAPCVALAAPGARAQSAWLQVEEPAEALQIRGSMGLVSVRGLAGLAQMAGHDVMIALDRSVSVWDPTGTDVDGDGIVGRARRGVDLFTDYQRICSDPGDTILQAQLRAARGLIESFDPATTRMGLLSFDSGAYVHAPIGSSREQLLHALRALPRDSHLGGTSFEAAFKLARAQFQGLPPARGPAATARTRSLILLSDGRPTQPAPIAHARRFAVVAAQDLAREDVRIFAFAMRPGEDEEMDVYRQVAATTGGTLYLADTPADVIEFAPLVPLTGLQRVEIDNLSASKPARALRVQPDGAFDGFAPLIPGMNVLRIAAVGERGEQSIVHRRVWFEPLDRAGAEERARMQGILRELKLRALQAEMERAARERMKRATDRSLRIDLSDAADGD